MNKVGLPTADDAAAFAALANNPQLASYPHLLPLVPMVQAAYQHCLAANGQPVLVLAPLSDDQATAFRGHYKSPPKDLAYIKEMRKSTEHKVCAMCGSMHSGTLDHYLPKNGFPIFAIFSRNLVPACKCNIKRKETLFGAVAGERVLHPYFDACMSDRLIRAQFDDLSAVPRVSLAITIAATHPEFSAVRFHVLSIVQQSAIKKYLADRWSKFIRKPSLVIRELKRNVASQAELQSILTTELSDLDDLHDSKNNWNSVFVAGLCEIQTLTWLYGRFAIAGRVPDSPLV